MRDLPTNSFPRLIVFDIEFLGRKGSNKEIKKILFDMVPSKASGSDYFQAFFFQNQWEVVGSDICAWVKKVFSGDIIDLKLDNTLIVLIPKVASLESFTQFRPIIVCFVLYKLIMKIIDNRFKLIFPKIIAQKQAEFIMRGSTTDKVIIA